MRTPSIKNDKGRQDKSRDRSLSFAMLFDNFPDPTLVTDIDGNICYVNPVWEKATGYVSKEVIGRNPRFLGSGKTPKSVHKKLWKSLLSGKSFISEEVIDKRKDGTEFQIRSTYFPIKKGNAIVYLAQIYQDITMQKEREVLHQRLESLIDNSNDAIILVTPKFCITGWNRAAERLYAYKEKEIIGASLTSLIPKGFRRTTREMFQLSIENKIVNFQTIRQKKDGNLINVAITASPLYDNYGNLFGFSVIHRDISEQKKNEELRESFVSMAAHELKTPITTLKLISSVLIKQLDIKSGGKNPFSLLDRELDRLTDLVNQMLDLSRIETGKLVLTPKKFDITDFTQEVVDKIRLLSPDHAISFRKTRSYFVNADEYKIEQVLTNLLTNAIKYSPSKTKIQVTIRMKGAKIILAVKDQGYGIPKEKLPRLFEKFYQVTDKGSKGFGLGLFICKEIIERHSGAINVESRVGKGSTFSFSLPYVRR